MSLQAVQVVQVMQAMQVMPALQAVQVLPKELMNIINQYRYYDIRTPAYARHLASKRGGTIETIKRALSRQNPPPDIVAENDEEHWVFGFYDNDCGGETLQMQPINCKCCGNYKVISNNQLHNHCLSNCPHIMCGCDDNMYRDWLLSDSDSELDDDLDNDFDMSLESD